VDEGWNLVMGRALKTFVALGIVALCALALVAVLTQGSAYEVRGEVSVPYEAGTVEEVRVLDAFTVYADGEPKPGASVIAGIGLIVLGTAAFVTGFAVRFAGARRLWRFYWLASLGFTFAGLDELFAIHESIGHNLRFLADVPGVSRPDDLVMLLYLVPVAAFAYAFRDVFLGDPRARAALAIGAGVFALSAIADAASAGKAIEEGLEGIAGLFLAGGMITLMYTHLRAWLQVRVAVAPDDAIHASEGPARARREREPAHIGS
jgi:hypothetical protein